MLLVPSLSLFIAYIALSRRGRRGARLRVKWRRRA